MHRTIAMLLFTLPTAAVAFNTAFIRARSLSSTLRHPLSSSSLNANAAIPVTLLSGFLGSGKTSTLQYVLESSSHNLTIGVIVNDVAAVNIDSKLVKSTSIQDGNDVGYMEMQNGCACCSLSDELLTTVESLLDQRQQQTNKKPFDHILIELSGVADPTSVRGVFEGGRRDDHAIFSSTRPSRNPLEEWSGDGDSQSEKVKMTISKSPPRIVTLVDSTTFNSDFFTPDSVADRPAWIEAEKAVGQGENVITDADLCLGNGVVAELLVEQVEAADVVVINKLDLLEKLKTEGGSTLSDVEKVVAGLNKKAKVYSTSFGKVDVGAIFEGGHEPAHEHACDDPKCDDPSHNHDHDHDHDHDHGHDCGDPTCTDPTHDHSHDHEHSHSHSHSDSHDCGDPTCTDPTHNHAPKSTTTASTNTNSVGITSFTYKSDRPFNVGRLLSVLNTWPVPVKDTLDLGELATISREGIEVDGVAPGAGDVFASIIRSKGFCWMCPSLWDPDSGDSWRHDTAMFWSHAGKHFGITSAGKWWGTVVDKQKIKEYLVDMPEEYERVMNEDWTSEEWGDRRQELVFIGVNYDEEAIVATLDKCLLTDGEIDEMRVAVKVREQSILN